MSRQEDFIEAGIAYRMEHSKPMCIAGSNLADVERDFNRVLPFEAGCEYGYQYALTHPQWIPVEEELPKEKQKVLAYFSPNEKCDHEYACEALYNYGFHHWEDAEDPGVILEGVTHWMPIVPPRKED